MHKITRTDTASSVVGLSNVHKSFGALKVLDGVSFEVDRGEVLVLIGRSGSGKSTALRCIDRFETIDSGEIVVCGHRVSDPKLDLRALRQDVGIVFQSYNLFPHLTIEENITLAPCSVKGISKPKRRSRRGGSLPRSAWKTSSTNIPNSSPAASSSVRRSPARSPCSPR